MQGGIKYSYVKFRRAREIAATFLKFQLQEIFPFTASPAFTILSVNTKKEIARLPLARRFRMALEELGPVFIKFGQILSTRPDLVPPNFIAELTRLQDNVAPASSAEIAAVLQREWQDKAHGLFQKFETSSLAVASLSQVHKGVLKSGDKVAVKIQKPHIALSIDLDLELLREAASVWEKRSETGWVYQPRVMVDEFSRVIKRELNFEDEARNYERFRQNLRDLKYVKVPKVYWELTTKRVLVTELIEGIKITDTIKPEFREAYDHTLIVRRTAAAIFKQIFEDGFFHADPHAGNIFVLPGNIIVFLDLGMIGWLDDKTMWSAYKIFSSFFKKDPTLGIHGLEELHMMTREVDRESLKLDLREFSIRYSGTSVRHMKLGPLFNDLIAIFVKHHMVMPRNLVFIIKTFGTLEDICGKLDPDFNFAKELGFALDQFVLKRFSLPQIWERIQGAFHDIIQSMSSVPHELVNLIEKLGEGKIKFIFEHKGLEHLIQTLEHSISRLSFSIILASFMLSWALIIRNQGLVQGLSMLGIFGLAITIVWAIWLIISMTRRK